MKWLSAKDSTYETEVISGSTDSLVIVWTLKNGFYEPEILKGHESNVNIVDGLYKQHDKNDAVVVSASMDCTVKVWYRVKSTGKFTLVLCFIKLTCLCFR